MQEINRQEFLKFVFDDAFIQKLQEVECQAELCEEGEISFMLNY